MMNQSRTLALIVVLLTVAVGCQRDNPLSPGPGTAPTALNDAAASVANALSRNNGGAFDQIGDIALITSAAGTRNEAGVMLDRFSMDSVVTNITKTYDSTNGWWTLTMYRQRIGLLCTSYFTREYQYQFLNKSNAYQEFWLTGTDTAYSIHFKIVSGTGNSIGPRMHHHLNSLSGEWMVTGTNTDRITINTFNNGAYMRAGSDTLTTFDATRTLNYTLSLTFTDVTLLRGSRFDNDDERDSIGGTITGTYDASITFTRGSLYRERTIHRAISITLGGGEDEEGGHFGGADIRFGDIHFRSGLCSGDMH